MSKNNATIVKKYCKVCHDAGKSEDEYRSHCTRETRDIKSKVLCPTLLALECRYCYQAGHTVKYCPVLKEKEKISTVREKGVRRDEALVRYTESSITVSSNKTKKPNTFACLDAESDEDEQKVSKKSVVKEDYPVLCAPIKRAPVSKSNYAAALASVPAVKAPTPAPWALASNDRPKAAKISWAAMASDSEDDEEEEDEEVEVEEEDW